MQIRGQGRWEGEKREKGRRGERWNMIPLLVRLGTAATGTHGVPRYEKHVIGEAAICML